MTVLTDEEIAAGWRSHTPGDPMPCDPETRVQYRLRSIESSEVPVEARHLRWSPDIYDGIACIYYDDGADDIIAWRPVEETQQLTRSDGGSTSYYRLPEHATELRHLISHKSMSKSRGDIFKACYRLGEKEGADILYDLKKMEFFIQDLIEMHERGEHI